MRMVTTAPNNVGMLLDYVGVYGKRKEQKFLDQELISQTSQDVKFFVSEKLKNIAIQLNISSIH